MPINLHQHRNPNRAAHWRIRKSRWGFWVALDQTPGPGSHTIRWNTGQRMLTSLDPRNHERA